MESRTAAAHIYSALFASTGLFAGLAALYTWGEGPILQQTSLALVLIPWGDLLVTGPISLLAAAGLIGNRTWGSILGLMACGIYLFGSALVAVCLVWNGPSYSLQLVLPAVLGVLLGISYPIWLLLNTKHSVNQADAAALAVTPFLGAGLADPVNQPTVLNAYPIREPEI